MPTFNVKSIRRGILLINLGTPDAPSVSAVRKYLKTFLSDKRVINIPSVLRFLLLYLVILPFRTKRTAHAYQSIWMPKGSPLLYFSQQLSLKLQQLMGHKFNIALGMRYGNPGLSAALNQLKQCDQLTILPLYPQYSSAATGSAIEEVFNVLKTWDSIPSVKVISQFYDDASYIHALAEHMKPFLTTDTHILFSYHGLPERDIIASGCQSVCKKSCLSQNSLNTRCYRAQCMHTSHLLANALALPSESYTTTFQSRLGKTEWIKPYTDQILPKLIANDVKHLTIVCPSFIVDCLETLEEIGLQIKNHWLSIGGEQFTLIPCLNDSPLWLEALSKILDKQT